MGQLLLNVMDAQEARNVLRLKFHQDIYVALRTEIIPQHGSEERQLTDVMPPTEIGYCLRRNAEVGTIHGSFLRQHYRSNPTKNQAEDMPTSPWWAGAPAFHVLPSFQSWPADFASIESLRDKNLLAVHVGDLDGHGGWAGRGGASH
jgi:hypothetical protein